MNLHLAWIFIRRHQRRLARGAILLVIPCALFLCIFSFGLHEYFGGKEIPSLMLGGARTDSVALPYGPLSPQLFEGLGPHESAAVVPIVYLNLQNVYSYATLSRIRFSVLIVPDEFITSRISPHLADDLFLEEGKYRCLLGRQAAQLWNLTKDDVIAFSLPPNFLFEKASRGEEGEGRFRVAGVLEKDSRFQLFDGAVFIPASAAKHLSNEGLMWNAALCYLSDADSYNAWASKAPLMGLSVVIRRPPLVASGVSLIGLLALLLSAALNTGVIVSALVAESSRDFGILRSMGARQRELKTALAVCVVLLQGVSLLAAWCAANAGFAVLNRLLARQSSYLFLNTYFRLDEMALSVLLACGAISSILAVLVCMRKIQRLAPEDLIRQPR